MYELDPDHPQVDDFLAANGKRVPLEVQNEPAGDAVIRCWRERGGAIRLDLDVSAAVAKEFG